MAMEDNGGCCCLDATDVERCSVWDYSRREAEEYKWIESERAGHDLGESALKSWVREHWWGFLRARWIEHLHGARFWIELDHDDFGLILREFQDQQPLLGEIVAQLKAGKENLDIIRWARERSIPVDPVILILERLDVNGHRLIHKLDSL
jgi:hypothetical protein